MTSDKSSLRRAALELRQNLPDAVRVEAAERFTLLFLENILLDPAHVVSAYWPLKNEIDVRPLMTVLHDMGHVCALPKIQSRGAALSFTRWTPGAALTETSFGTMETDGDVVIPDVLIVPMLGFDTQGHRLGYGAGHFDRTFSAFRTAGRKFMSIGVAYEQQWLAAVPAEAHDVPMDIIVTDQKIYKIANKKTGDQA